MRLVGHDSVNNRPAQFFIFVLPFPVRHIFAVKERHWRAQFELFVDIGLTPFRRGFAQPGDVFTTDPVAPPAGLGGVVALAVGDAMFYAAKSDGLASGRAAS